MASRKGGPKPAERQDLLAIAIIGGFFAARVAFALALGLGIDESYTLAIARTLSLSYFDHPPLHQWIAHFAARALGEGFGARLPFIAMFAATGWIFYRLTLDLFGARAGLVALFALNVTPFFFASAGTWIVPDGPLLFGLCVAVWALAQLFFPKGREPDARSAWRLWLIVGVGFGLAGLSKYSAALSVVGVAVFVALAPGQRRWLFHRAPYVAAAMALTMASPAIIWNAEHSWASFAFQGSRGTPGGGLKPTQVLVMAVGEIAYLFPWTFAASVASIGVAWRKRLDERRLFLVCLALPPILLFTLTPLWGARGLPQWTMSGWLFAFPLLGAWLDERATSSGALRRWAFISCGTLAAVAAVVVVQASTGWPQRALPLPRTVADPTLEAFDWGALRNARALQSNPAFVLATRWSDAGKIALALGPAMPVFALSNDPRGWAFVEGGRKLLGDDGVLITRAADASLARAAVASAFKSIGETEFVTLTRNGCAEIELALVPVHGLTRSLPLPYPGATGG